MPKTDQMHSVDEFDVADLDLGDLTVVSMMDSAALPESGASYQSSSTCVVVVD